MNQNTSESKLVEEFLRGGQDGMGLRGNWLVEITRANGEVESKYIKNVVLTTGMDFVAARAIANTQSAMNYIAIGTVTAQPSMGSTTFGEINRKVGALVASSREVIILSNTWGGASDSLTGVALGSAVVANHASSGQGTYLNMSNSVNTTLQQSDILRLQAEIRCGSHG